MEEIVEIWILAENIPLFPLSSRLHFHSVLSFHSEFSSGSIYKGTLLVEAGVFCE